MGEVHPNGTAAAAGAETYSITDGTPRTRMQIDPSVVHDVIAAQAPVGMVAVDFHGRVVFVNDYFCDFVGHVESELLGTPIADLLHPDERVSGLTRWATRIVSGENRFRPSTADREVVTYRAADGSRLPAEVTWTMTTPAADGARYTVICLTRLTNEPSAEDELTEMSQRFALAFKLAPVALAMLGLDGRIEKSNQAMQRLLGYPEAELVGMSFRQINHPENGPVSERNYEALVTGRIEQHDSIKRYIRKDGSVILCRRVVALTRDKAGLPSRLILIAEPMDVHDPGSG